MYYSFDIFYLPIFYLINEFCCILGNILIIDKVLSLSLWDLENKLRRFLLSSIAWNS